MILPEDHSGVMCARCDADLIVHPDHMCGTDPIVSATEKTLIPVPGLPSKLCCKYCYSFVGRQHYDCPKATDTKKSWLSYYWERKYRLSWWWRDLWSKL